MGLFQYHPLWLFFIFPILSFDDDDDDDDDNDDDDDDDDDDDYYYYYWQFSFVHKKNVQ